MTVRRQHAGQQRSRRGRARPARPGPRPRRYRRPGPLRRALRRLRTSRPRTGRLGLARLRASRLARRGAIAGALLAVLVIPLPVLAADAPAHHLACAGAACRAQPQSDQLWAVRLPGAWSADVTGDGGTAPATGQAYLGVGDGTAALGRGLQVTGYVLATGAQRWQTTLNAAPGTAIMSVRAWPGVVTVGLLAPDGHSRTEVVLSAEDGAVVRRYPAAVLGGAVAASAATTVVISRSAVTSYDNMTGRVRWRRATDGGQSWQVDGQTLYLAQLAGGADGSAAVTALKVISLASGAERTLSSPLGQPFSGTLGLAAEGTVLFASASGLTAYSGATGALLWARPGAVAEGSDPEAGLLYLSGADGALRGVDPVTGQVLASVPGSAIPGSGSVYVVRNGTAFGLEAGAGGVASEYSTAQGRVSWTSNALPWPHFFADVSGLGGSAPVPGDPDSGGTPSGEIVVVAACPRLTMASRVCTDPELVAFRLVSEGL